MRVRSHALTPAARGCNAPIRARPRARTHRSSEPPQRLRRYHAAEPSCSLAGCVGRCWSSAEAVSQSLRAHSGAPSPGSTLFEHRTCPWSRRSFTVKQVEALRRPSADEGALQQQPAQRASKGATDRHNLLTPRPSTCHDGVGACQNQAARRRVRGPCWTSGQRQAWMVPRPP